MTVTLRREKRPSAPAWGLGIAGLTLGLLHVGGAYVRAIEAEDWQQVQSLFVRHSVLVGVAVLVLLTLVAALNVVIMGRTWRLRRKLRAERPAWLISIAYHAAHSTSGDDANPNVFGLHPLVVATSPSGIEIWRSGCEAPVLGIPASRIAGIEIEPVGWRQTAMVLCLNEPEEQIQMSLADERASSVVGSSAVAVTRTIREISDMLDKGAR